MAEKADREGKMNSLKLIMPLVILLTISLTGCGPLVTFVADFSMFDKKNDMQGHPLAEDEFAKSIAKKFGLMALFSETAYRRNVTKGQKACNSEDPFGMPLPEDENGPRWSRYRAAGEVKACVNEAGLFYETYVYGVNGQYTEAVIAFRGTEDWEDWPANLSAAFGFQPKQYKLARGYVPRLIESLTDANAGIKIYAVGHSLGGGLAQQAGYLSKGISEVITFNPSPVTNWSYLRMGGDVENNYPIIYRVFHNGEILEKVRFISTSFTKTRYGRYDIGIQLTAKSSIKGHSMSIFACSFAGLIALDESGADHHYSSKAAGATFSNTGICSQADVEEYRKIIRQGSSQKSNVL